jgi:hypothetical protein
MSQINRTNQERIQVLMTLGYTEREATFLCLAGLHSGFFLRRQFCQFIGSNAGGADATLVEKLLKKGHGTSVAGCSKAMIYHISARPFYAALGQEDNRNRRMRPPVSIKNRLMGLDYLLDHPRHQYFATEQEKISYFTCTLGFDLADLPVKPFRSPNAEDSTSRFFVDKYPIFVREQTDPSRVVCFCFIDEGVATSSRFETYLHQYRRLFSRLPRFEVVYAAASPALFWEAERVFRGFVSGQPKGHSATLGSPDLVRLVNHFQDRQLYDARKLDSFDRLKLIRLRDEREEFSGAFFESLYRTWEAGGQEAVQASLALKTSAAEPLHGSLSTCLLRHTYDLFGTSSKTNHG